MTTPPGEPTHAAALPPSDFGDIAIRTFYSVGDQPFRSFYVPLLQRAVRYDRLVGYFRAATLSRAAVGTAAFVARGGRIRLIAGADLADHDVEAVLEGEPLENVLVEQILRDPLDTGVDLVRREYLRLLAWMVREGRCEIRIGVPVDPQGQPLRRDEADGYFHSKYGIFTDEIGNQIAFAGSENETPAGWLKNHETFQVYWTANALVWDQYGAPIVERFERHWTTPAPEPGWTVVSLPNAARDKLIALLPDDYVPPFEEPEAWLRPPTPGQPATSDDVDLPRKRLLRILGAPCEEGGTGVGLLSAEAEPLPHQLRIAYRAVATYPRSYLLADEVGLGKTIEVGLIVRELMLSGHAESALLLVPSSVLRQWQEELHEKLSLDVPRYTGKIFVDRFDREIPSDSSSNPWSAFPIVLGSSHLARRAARRKEVLAGGPWDIVMVDEAHHARRRGAKSNETPNALLALLQSMREAGAWKALYLASATPMQMAPHEAWDLIELFGLPGRWGHTAADFERYFVTLREESSHRDWLLLTRMLADYMADEDTYRDSPLEQTLRRELGFAKAGAVSRLHKANVTANNVKTWSPEQAEGAERWLRAHTPMRDRVFRTTRKTLLAYQAKGILDAHVVIPRRIIQDEFVELSAGEQKLYDRIDAYISRHYNAYRTDQTRQALGFIMTVYRRRLTSSFHAIRCSLARRLHALESGRNLLSALDDDDIFTGEDEGLFDTADLDITSQLLGEEINELRDFIASIDDLLGQDTKARQLDMDLDAALVRYDSVVIFTQYTDTMEYLRDRLAQTYGRIACYSGRGGEEYDPTTAQWVTVSKAELKTRFRDKHIRVLIGTDAMSEGLNLQTCGRVFNYDVPWNFMRMEQRIGRVDRIGATYPVVTVSNYFYDGTVEQRVYDGIKGDFGDFVDIVGDAQPVLAATEDAIRQVALSSSADREKVLAVQLAQLRLRVSGATSGAVRLSDVEDEDPEDPPTLHPAAGLADLEHELISNPLTRHALLPVHGRPGVYRLVLPGRPLPVSFGYRLDTLSPGVWHADPDLEPPLVAFDRDVVDRADTDVRLMTWGTPELEALVAGIVPRGAEMAGD